MKIVGIISNPSRDAGLSFAREIAKWLKSRDVEVAFESDENFKAADFYAVLGGDGTVLRAANNIEVGKPILGINLGNLGYLTAAERSEAFEALQHVLAGNFKIESRMMLEATVDERGLCFALNDVCITRGALTKLIQVEMYVNEEYIDTYRADGIIVATPTGSTAYNLAAGGPILKPDAQMIAITPICPHMLHARSLVVSGTDEVYLKILQIGEKNECILSIDGRHEMNLKTGDTIAIKQSQRYTSIIRTNHLGFFDIVRTKMVKG